MIERAARMHLRLSRLREPWACAGVLFVGYALTMARSLTFYDSPELALVAHELGVGHPIGQPLHTVLGFVWAHLPGVSAHVGLTLMSAGFGALAAIPAWSLSEIIMPPKGGGAESVARGLAIVGFGLGMIAWEPATRVEVYTLAAFCALWATARVADRGADAWAGLVLGLGAGAHAVIAVAQGLGLVAVAWPRGSVGEEPDQESGEEPNEGSDEESDAESHQPPLSAGAAGASWRSVGAMVGGGLSGLLVYALVPLLAAGHPERFTWGAPRDAASLGAYLRGADYAHNQGIDIGSWLDHLGQLLGWGLANGTLAVAALGAVAFLALALRRPDGKTRALAWTWLVAVVVDVGFVGANVVFHPDVPDYRGYFLVPLWMSAAGLGGLASWLATHAGRRRVYGVVCAALPALSILASPSHLAGPRDDPSLGEIMARGALSESSRGAIVVVESDHWVAPLLYLQEAEAVREDVVVVAFGLSSSSWYWEHTFARHPGLREMSLFGAGGRPGRIRRLLDANPERPVQVESVAIAAALGLRACGVGYLLHTQCSEGPHPGAATSAIALAAPFRGESLEVAARVGEARGDALWRLGHVDAAAQAWLAGLAASGLGVAAPSGLPERGPPLRGPLPDWTRPAALHDPARNLAMAALLLESLGRRAEAIRLVDAAVAEGLSEAAQARARILAGP